MSRDRLDNQLISVLSVDPTLTRNQLAAKLGRTYETIQRVLARLSVTHVIKPGFIVTAESLEGLVNYWIMIQTRSLNASGDSKLDYQSRLCGQIGAALTGPEWRDRLVFRRIDILFGADWDIILLVSARSAQTIQALVTGYLRSQCPEIVGTRTAWSTQAFAAPLADDEPAAPSSRPPKQPSRPADGRKRRPRGPRPG